MCVFCEGVGLREKERGMGRPNVVAMTRGLSPYSSRSLANYDVSVSDVPHRVQALRVTDEPGSPIVCYEMSKITNYEREYVNGIDVVPLLGCPRRDTGTVKYGRVTFVDGNEKNLQLVTISSSPSESRPTITNTPPSLNLMLRLRLS